MIGPIILRMNLLIWEADYSKEGKLFCNRKQKTVMIIINLMSAFQI